MTDAFFGQACQFFDENSTPGAAFRYSRSGGRMAAITATGGTGTDMCIRATIGSTRDGG
jgi:hypothetical protein